MAAVGSIALLMGLPVCVGLSSKAMSIPTQRTAGLATLVLLGLQIATLVVLTGIGFTRTAIQ